MHLWRTIVTWVGKGWQDACASKLCLLNEKYGGTVADVGSLTAQQWATLGALRCAARAEVAVSMDPTGGLELKWRGEISLKAWCFTLYMFFFVLLKSTRSSGFSSRVWIRWSGNDSERFQQMLFMEDLLHSGSWLFGQSEHNQIAGSSRVEPFPEVPLLSKACLQLLRKLPLKKLGGSFFPNLWLRLRLSVYATYYCAYTICIYTYV